MNLKVLLFLACFSITACGGWVTNDESSFVTRTETVKEEPALTQQFLTFGTFEKNARLVKGSVMTLKNESGYFLVIRGFQSTRGPNTRIGLSQTDAGTSIIDLGAPSTFSGTVVFSLSPEQVGLPYVLVYDRTQGIYAVAKLQ